MRRALVTALYAFTAILGVWDAALSAVKTREPAGRVRFLNHASSAFERYSLSPSGSDQAWMREHYFRMLTYSPYFDARLQWYPNAWMYKDAYAIRSSWPIFASHPEWVLRDENGTMLYIPWSCSSGVCPQFAADFGNAEFRTNWIREARLSLAQGYVGLYIDDVNMAWRVSDGNGNFVTPIDPRTRAPMNTGCFSRHRDSAQRDLVCGQPRRCLHPSTDPSV